MTDRPRAMLQTTLVGAPCELRIYNGTSIAGNGVAMVGLDDDALYDLLDDIMAEIRLRRRLIGS